MPAASPSPIKDQKEWEKRLQELHREGETLEEKISRRKAEKSLLKDLQGRLGQLKGQIDELSLGLDKSLSDLEAQQKKKQAEFAAHTGKKTHELVKEAQQKAQRKVEEVLKPHWFREKIYQFGGRK
jgi:small-conductance mechanosensitive channel